MTKQTITIHHDRKEPGPLVIDHVPPLGADGMNCTLRNGTRGRILCIDRPSHSGLYVVVMFRDGSTGSRRANGAWLQTSEHSGDIIALDGQPAEPALVRVDTVAVGDVVRLDGTWWRVDRTPVNGFIDVTPLHPCEIQRTHRVMGVATMVRPLAPSEKLVITVTAEGA